MVCALIETYGPHIALKFFDVSFKSKSALLIRFQSAEASPGAAASYRSVTVSCVSYDANDLRKSYAASLVLFRFNSGFQFTRRRGGWWCGHHHLAHLADELG